MFNIQQEIIPFSVDKAVVWTDCEEEKRRLEEIGVRTIPGVGKVRIERWSPNSQFKNTKIEYRQSWIGVEGLPLNLWNENIFRLIGRKCRGLLDIARSTSQMTCLSHAQLKMQGNEGGFIQETLELSCWGKRIQVKLFSLNTRFSSCHGVKPGLGQDTKKEDEVDVAVWADTGLTTGEKVHLNSAISNKSRRQQEARLTTGKITACSNAGVVDGYGKSASSAQISQSPVLEAVKKPR